MVIAIYFTSIFCDIALFISDFCSAKTPSNQKNAFS